MNIVVTGASRGIGFELVKTLSVNPQHRILAIARNISALKMLQKICQEQSGNEIAIKELDISSEGFQGHLTAGLNQTMESVDILVNNAGLLINKPIQQLDGDDFDKIFAVNVRSPFLLIQAMLPFFNRPSHIVNIGSMGGYQGSAKFPGLSLYSASKGALATLTECMAQELANRDIRINCLALGSAQTEMLRKAFPEFQAPVSAAEMGKFIAEFSLNGHKYFNGKILPVALSTP
jgi:NAD(P)-dependent dehydrogenase (short-subunit alcohol dehydrogenase family)